MDVPKVELFALCDYATISQDQKLSVIGIFDQFFVANLPTNWHRMFLVGVLKGDPGKEYPLTLKVKPPEKTESAFPDKEFKMKLGTNGKSNLITELVNFPLTSGGIYKVELFSGKEKIASLEFTVNKTTATYEGDQIGKKVTN